jgi:hypothetical protein
MAPDGTRLADLHASTAYTSPQINATVDAAPDPNWAVDDKITLKVSEGDQEVVAVDFAAVDGTQEAYGILLGDVTAPDGVDAEGLALYREADIVESPLVWPDGATTEQKTQAKAELKAAGIVVLKEV